MSFIPHMPCDRCAALEAKVNDLSSRLDERTRERDGWIESARHFADGQSFYQGLVRKIGALYGMEARTSDDGSAQEDVLALKVPELVEHYMRQAAEISAMAKRCDDRANEAERRLDKVLVLVADLSVSDCPTCHEVQALFGAVVERRDPIDCSHLWKPLNEDQAKCDRCGSVEWRGIARV